MDDRSLIKLGKVHNISVKENHNRDGELWIECYTDSNQRFLIPITSYVGRVIWFKLTEGLYPHALGRFTSRMSTAALNIPDTPSVIHAIKMHISLDTRRVYIAGINAVSGIYINLDFLGAEELWTGLTDFVAMERHA